ncbi:PAS domain S-box protein [candidate division KSB1 bacterium]|nr:PAS domain S-box protein [candidate division KSB1 bacterium]
MDDNNKRQGKESEAQDCFMQSPFPICLTDRNGRIITANRAFARLLDKSIEQIENRLLYSLWPAPSRRSLQQMLPLTVTQYEFALFLPGGNGARWFRGSVRKISGRRQEKRFLWHFFADQLSDQNLQMLLSVLTQSPHNAEDAILVLDGADRVQFHNKVCNDHRIFKKGRLLNRPLQSICKKSFYQTITKPFHLARQGKHGHKLSIFKAENERWIESTFFPLVTRGHYLGMLAIFRDVTEIKKKEHEAEASRKIFSELFDKVDVGIIVMDKDKFIYTNPAAQRMLGQPIPPGTRGLDAQLKQYSENIKLWQNAQRRLMGKKVPEQYEHKIITRDGEARHLEIISRLVKVDDRKMVVATLVDITPLKDNEQLLQQRADELQVLNRLAHVSNQTLALDTILSDTLKSIMKQINASLGFVFFYDNASTQLRLVKSRGLTKKELTVLLPPEASLPLTLKTIRTARPIWGRHEDDLDHYPPLRRVGITSYLIIPLTCKGQPLGSINLANRGQRPLCVLSEDVLVGIGNQIGVAIENARLLQERENEIIQYAKTEQALRESEERYRTLAETANDMIFIIDVDDRVVYANKFAAMQFNVEPAQLRGKERCELFPPEVSAHQKKAIDHVLKTGKPYYSEDKTPFPDQTLWLGSWLAPIYNADGEIIQILGVARDITQAKETALALQKSEQRFRDIIERSPDGYYFFDKHSQVTKVNKAFQEIINIKRAQFLDKDFFATCDEDSRQRARKIFARVMGGRGIKWDEFELKNADGDSRWFGFNARRVMRDGVVIGMEGFVKDITEQKIIAEALQRSEARYRALFDSIPYEVFGMDTSGYYREANRAFIRNWGEVVGKKASEAASHPHFNRFIEKMRTRVLKNQITVQESLEIDMGQGLIYYSCLLCPVGTREREIIGLVGLNIDVTEQAITYERLKSLSKRLVQVQEEERARISREIHDSLGQYLTALQLEISAALKDSRETPPQTLREAQQTIKQSINIASSLCYTLRPPLLDDFGLVSALKDYFHDFEDKWRIPVSFQTVDISNLLSKDQETALFRVTQEAFTNILKHARAHHIEVMITVSDDMVVLTVLDDGRGFNYQELSKQIKTTGFGLITMKERIELLGGRFNVGTAERAGTRITAELPFNGGA